MLISRSRPLLAALIVSLSGLTVACAPAAPSRYDQVQQETSQKGSQSVAQEAVNGSQFNRYFPKSGNGFAVVPAQEKQGFAEHKLNQGGKTMAMLSINDTISNPAAAQKFQQSSTRIGGFPAVSQGQTGTAVLVGDRFQVKALSRDPAFTSQDRAQWIQKFDLNGLSNLK